MWGARVRRLTFQGAGGVGRFRPCGSGTVGFSDRFVGGVADRFYDRIWDQIWARLASFSSLFPSFFTTGSRSWISIKIVDCFRPTRCGKITKIRYTLCKIREIDGPDVYYILYGILSSFTWVFSMIWASFGDTFPASISGRLVCSILSNFGPKIDPSGHPESVQTRI